MDKGDVLELRFRGPGNAGALVDFFRINQVENRQILRGQYEVHGIQAEASLPIQKVRDMRLLQPGSRRQSGAGQPAVPHLLPQSLAQAFLKHFESHGLPPQAGSQYSGNGT
jgi:hypothetical protein